MIQFIHYFREDEGGMLLVKVGKKKITQPHGATTE
jgi:hypothetical protein